MATQVQFRRGNTTQTSTFTGAVAEITVDTDKKTLVIHDGSTAGGTPLAKEGVLSTVYTHANGAFDKANSANVLAQAAFDKANTGNVLAQSAFDKANTANVTAEAAYSKANTANVLAQNAYNAANSAATIADILALSIALG